MDIRVWVGCLACYNDGRLVGEWVNAAYASDWTCPDLTHEEMWIFDHEIPGVSGEMDPVTATRWAEVFDDLNETDLEPFAVWLGNAGIKDPEKASADSMRDAYVGYFDSHRAFAMEMADAVGYDFDKEVWPATCIDWDHAANELLIDGYWEQSGHYFHD